MSYYNFLNLHLLFDREKFNALESLANEWRSLYKTEEWWIKQEIFEAGDKSPEVGTVK